MDSPLLGFNNGQKMRWTGYGIEVSVLTEVISRTINTELQTRGMTIFKSYWELTSYHHEGQLHHWLSGVLDQSMRNALVRFCSQPLSAIKIEEYSLKHWEAFESSNRFGVPARHEVWMQDEMPVLKVEHITIYDSRHEELLLQIRKQEKEEPDRPGFKKLPLQFSFGLRS